MYKEKSGITLIALVITVIVLLVLAGISISMLIGENGILTQAKKAKEITEIASEEECIKLIITEEEITKEKIGEKLKKVEFNTVEDTKSIIDSETGTTYANGWYYLKPEDVSDYELKIHI